MEVFTAPARENRGPGRAGDHRIKPSFAEIGNTPLIGAWLGSRASTSFTSPVHLRRSKLTLLGGCEGAAPGAALLVHYRTAGWTRAPAGPCSGPTAHGRAALVREGGPGLRLSGDHANSVPTLAGPRRASSRKAGRGANGVDTAILAPTDRSGVRAPHWVTGALVAAFVATLDRAHHFKRLDLAIEALARIAAKARDLRHLVVAGGGELFEAFDVTATNAGMGERVHFRSVPHAELPGVLRGADPPAHHRAARVVRDSSDRGDGLRAAVIARKYRRSASGCRRGGKPGSSSPGDAGAVTAPARRLVRPAPSGRAQMGTAGRKKCERLWSSPRLLDRMDGAYAEAIAARREKTGGRRERRDLLLVAYFYPPCRDTGAPPARGDGPVATTAGPSGHGADDVRVGTPTTATQRAPSATPDLQRLRARLHGHDRVDALFDSDTYSGPPHVLRG